jgi:uncharacterized membrane protein YdbT with pleckstrin-like domain
MFTSHYFPGKEKDENIILILRRHWFVIIKFSAKFLLFTAIPAGIYFVIVNFYPSLINNTNSLSYALLLLGASFYYLFIWLLLFATWLDYYLDVWIVTNKRIISIELKGLFFRVISELRISRVQDVTSEIQGMIPTFLKYGNVYVQTAAEQERFFFKQVPNPDFVKRKIIELHDEEGKIEMKDEIDEFTRAFPNLAKKLEDQKNSKK